MAKFQLNTLTQKIQRRTLISVVIGVGSVLIAVMTLAVGGKHHASKQDKKNEQLAGVVDESFSEANTESALSQQQAELESLKNQMLQLKDEIQKNKQAHEAEVLALEKHVADTENKASPSLQSTQKIVPTQLHAISFHYRKQHQSSNDHHLNPEHYVPSGTFVRAVILGGADADASVNGQSKNNGVMLFKLLQPGTLPNGQHSHLQGCFITGSSYGDISSERAFVVLDKLSCAQSGQPIIDKNVTGWAFFGGKVGVKGIPLMRDNKVMQWAGISGAMSGIASAAQYAQSVQNISPLGAATTVPSGNVAPYAAYGGASKAAEVLSSYYVKRAEQYHPVIQVGSGNLVTIVFKDGFYLEPDEAQVSKRHRGHTLESSQDDEPNFEVPPEVLRKIDQKSEINHEP